VQRLAGSAERGQSCFFFASSGYTKAAISWAVIPDHRVSLFIMRPDGHIVACNYHARRTLWRTRPRKMPRHVSVPSRRELVGLFSSSFVFIAGTLVFGGGIIYAAIIGDGILALIFLAAMMAVNLFMSIETIRGPLAMIIIGIARGHRPDVSKAFASVNRSRPDEGLPSDEYIGHRRDPILIALIAMTDIGVHLRTLRRLLRRRSA
jgi:hypothetical protein